MKFRRILAATVAVASGVLIVLPPSTAQAADPPPPTGLTSVTASPSCWAIKQSHPNSPNGVYWLQTAKLVSPQQFYCDMTTDGGGWVLVARGRQGWNWSYNGQGTPAAVRTTTTGTGAFTPAALPAKTIDGLLDGGRVDSLVDGVRFRRATDSAGANWQEMRWRFAKRDRWSWMISAGHPIAQFTIDGVNRGSGSSRSWANDNSYRYVATARIQQHGWAAGFSFGPTIGGANNTTSYLWEYASENAAIPFTQVFIRPRITEDTFDEIPAAGTPAKTLSPLMDSKTVNTTPWGVTGCIGGCTELNLEAEGLAQVGNTMFVGGAFQYVQKGANPAAGEKVEQRYIAGFDVNTGEWRSGFRPVVNGLVWDLAKTPDNKLIISGDFTTVNGVAVGGLAKLDPVTGAVDPKWRSNVLNGTARGRARAIDVQGSWLYVGGDFTRITGGDPTAGALFGPVTVGRAARVNVANGRPDGTWKPNFNGSIIELDASDRNDRVYFSGYFTAVNGVTGTNKVAVIDVTGGGALTPGMKKWVPSSPTVDKQYQQTIMEIGDSVWVGGSEHILGKYDRDDFTFERSFTTSQGGDFQALGVVNGVVYASCHCAENMWQDSSSWPNPSPGWTQVDGVTFVGAFDAVTGDYLPEFFPTLKARGGLGPWELTTDTNGCLWFGGDLIQGSYQTSSYQWLGGFGKFCGRDTVAPTKPTNLKATAGSGTGVSLTWGASTDNKGSLSYQVLRNDRVIATVSTTSFNDTTATQAGRYFVRAIDTAGNLGASTAGVTGGPKTTLISYNSSWAWAFDGVDRGTAWKNTSFDDSAWARAPAEFGFGDSDEETVISTGTPRPLTSYFRKTFEVSDPDLLTTLTLNLIRDDGAAVYLNGTEVARTNLPAGALTITTKASTGISDRAAETTPVSFTIPKSALVAGTNTIAVEMHNLEASGSDLSFDLQLLGQ